MYEPQDSYYAAKDTPRNDVKAPGSTYTTGSRYGWQTTYYYMPNSEPPAAAAPRKERKKPRRSFMRVLASVMAIVLLSAGAGAGGAYFMIYMLGMFDAPEIVTATETPPPAVPTVQPQQPPGVSASTISPPYGDVSAVVQRVAGSVVEIRVRSEQGGGFFGAQTAYGAGSGVIISEDGYIVTNDHVIEGATRIVVRLNDGTEFDAAVIGTDSRTDLAILKIDAEGLTPAEFADSDLIEVGQIAIAIGNPLGELGGTVTSGIISAKGREITIHGETMTLIQTSAAVNRGNSGGGLFDHHGRVVGIVNAKSAGVGIEGLAFAIPSNIVSSVTNDLLTFGFVRGRPQFGITIMEINDLRSAAEQGLNVTQPGVYVFEVGPDTPLRVGDLFVSIDDTEIRRSADVAAILRRSNVGDVLSVTVIRNGETITLPVTLMERVPEGFRQEASIA